MAAKAEKRYKCTMGVARQFSFLPIVQLHTYLVAKISIPKTTFCIGAVFVPLATIHATYTLNSAIQWLKQQN